MCGVRGLRSLRRSCSEELRGKSGDSPRTVTLCHQASVAKSIKHSGEVNATWKDKGAL